MSDKDVMISIRGLHKHLETWKFSRASTLMCTAAKRW